MGLFEGKTSTERNKIIAAGVLGVVALFALYMAFGRGFFRGSSTTATTKSTPSPKPSPSPGSRRTDTTLPTADEQDFVYQTTELVYPLRNNGAPDAGRNIFAFYEPPPPCTKDCPTPPVKTPPPLPPPTAAPTPPIQITFLNPQNVFAGSPGFRLELGGNFFTADSRIYFNQSEMPTTFVSGQRLFADIQAALITQEGQRQVIIQTPDGRMYSNQVMLNVQPPPRPTYAYIGMIARKRYNNDTAYFTEPGKDKPFGARLNDILAGRFRLIDISAAEVVFEDVSLGFKHRLAITKGVSAGIGTGGGQSIPRPGFPIDGSFQPGDPNMQNIPGIPNNIPRYIPPPPPQEKKPIDAKKEDVDDNGDN